MFPAVEEGRTTTERKAGYNMVTHGNAFQVSKTNWNGILGTLPSFRNDVDNMYHYYVVEYERRFKVGSSQSELVV